MSFPPATSFTNQLTAVLELPDIVTAAVNCCVAPRFRETGVGVTLMDTWMGGAATVTAFGSLTTPPGLGLATVTFTVPICAAVAVPVAVSAVAETYVVARFTPPN